MVGTEGAEEGTRGVVKVEGLGVGQKELVELSAVGLEAVADFRLGPTSGRMKAGRGIDTALAPGQGLGESGKNSGAEVGFCGGLRGGCGGDERPHFAQKSDFDKDYVFRNLGGRPSGRAGLGGPLAGCERSYGSKERGGGDVEQGKRGLVLFGSYGITYVMGIYVEWIRENEGGPGR